MDLAGKEEEEGGVYVDFPTIRERFPCPTSQSGPWIVAMVVNTSGSKKKRNRVMIGESSDSLLEHLNSEKRGSVRGQGAVARREELLGAEESMYSEEEKAILERTKTSGYWANVVSVAGFEDWDLAVAFLYLWHNRTRGVNSRLFQVFGMMDQFAETHKLVLYYYNKSMMEHVEKAVRDISMSKNILDGDKRFSQERVKKLLSIIMNGRLTLANFKLFNQIRKKRPPKPPQNKRRRKKPVTA